MRRILRKIAEGEADKLGDTSTLADPSIVEVMLRQHTYISYIDHIASHNKQQSNAD